MAIVHEDYGNVFFLGLAAEAEREAMAAGLEMKLTRQLTRGSDESGFDESQLDRAIDDAVNAQPDVLMLFVRKPEMDHSLSRLLALRPETGDVSGKHAFKAIFWNGAQAGVEQDCFGLGVDCAYVVGATQLGRDEAYSTYDALLGQDYRWLGQRAGRPLDGFIPFPASAAGFQPATPLTRGSIPALMKAAEGC